MNLLTQPTRKSFVLLGIGALICLSAVVALTIATVSRADTAAVEPAAVEVFPPVTSHAEAAAQWSSFAERFAVLRISDAVAMPASSVIVDRGIDRSTVRVIRSASAERLALAGAKPVSSQLWLAPREDGTECILAQPRDAQGPAEICATLDGALAGHLMMTQTWTESDLEIYGLVPDGVHEVTVEFVDETSAVLPVVSNAYAAHLTKPTQAVVFTDAAGMQHRVLAQIEA
jgi:hypothetical protein